MGRPVGSSYLTEVEIGSGGYGTVWRATDRRTGELVAIKILHPEHTADPEVVGRFLRERAALLRLRHPNLVRLRDVVFEGTTLALVMDLVDGPTLDEQLRQRGCLPRDEAAAMVAQVAEALVVVHAAGIVHRDVKPSNILLAPLPVPAGAAQATARIGMADTEPVGYRASPSGREDGSGGFIPRLADFGIARLADSTQVTRSNQVVGTLAYLAPEALRGDPIDTRVDVYALGVVAYELLAGHPPFDGESHTVIHRHLYEEPPRPREIPDDLWGLIAACLAKDPDRRPTAGGLAASLRPYAERLGVPAATISAAGAPMATVAAPGHTALLPVDGHLAALRSAGIDPEATKIAPPPLRPEELAPPPPPTQTRQYTRQIDTPPPMAAPRPQERQRPPAEYGGGAAYAPPNQAPPYPPQSYPGPGYPGPSYPPPAPPGPRPGGGGGWRDREAPPRSRSRRGVRWWRMPGMGCLVRLAMLAVIVAVIWYFLGGREAWHSVESWWHTVNNWWQSVQGLYHDITSFGSSGTSAG